MRHCLPVFPGSLTTVASINRSVGTNADSVTRPRSSNSAQQSRYSQSLLLRSRLSKATSESSASLACRALTTVSRMEKPHPRCCLRLVSNSVRSYPCLPRGNPDHAAVNVVGDYCPVFVNDKLARRHFHVVGVAAVVIARHPGFPEFVMIGG